jgi:small-conductance mechanosensitive channel
MDNIWSKTYLGNTAINWLIAVAMILIGFLILRLVKNQVLRMLKKWSQTSRTTIDDFIIKVIENSVIPFLYFTCIYAVSLWLLLPEQVDRVFGVAMLLVSTFYILKSISAILEYFIVSFLKRQSNGESKQKQARGILIILKVLIWFFGIIFLLDNLGYNITTIIAGLGIGGIAVALAAQTVLGDLFSYFVILFDRPFEIGDFIIVEDKMGVVEYIGIKTTRLRTLGGEQLICSNKDLTDSRIHNYKRMERRRVLFQLGVTYEIHPTLLESIPSLVESIINEKQDVQFDRGHFSGFGDSSLKFEFIYYVLSADYAVFMNIQQEIYFEIFRLFNDKGISFAYPTQRLFVSRAGENDLEAA